jgi:large subunit ribosomal protein L6e
VLHALLFCFSLYVYLDAHPLLPCALLLSTGCCHLLLSIARPRAPGPYKINGVPLRRVNQSYVIATSTQVDVSKVDVSKIDDAFFARAKTHNTHTPAGDAFFSAESRSARAHGRFTPMPKPSDARVAETKRVSAALGAVIKGVPSLAKYLKAKFTLKRGQKPHELKF